MATRIQQKRCANHPDRYGHALCMSCRKVVCQECATTWDGINYCVVCIGQLRHVSRGRPSLISWSLLLLVVATLFWISSWAMVWGPSQIPR